MKLALLLIFSSLTATSVFAAVTGSISGTVRDPQGGVLPDTTVVLHNTSTGVVQTISTDSAGFYSFPSLSIGTYDVTFQKTGFEKYVQTEVVIDVDTAQRVDATLNVGSTSEQITVISTEAQVDTENAQLGDVITGTVMDEMPLADRSYTNLLMLQPGTVNISVSMYSTITPANSLANGELSIGGAQDVHSGFMVNGANTVDGAGEGTFLVPVMDSIAEFRIVTNNAGAEYGGYAGAITNVVTKSGTNQFHGDAFEYLRETYLNAADYFSHTNSPYQQSIFGGTVGGPILRNKVFFFADYQGTRYSTNNQIDVQAPTAADKTGDLSDRADRLTGSVNGDYFAQVLNQRLGLPAATIVSGEPYYAPDCTSTAQCVFPNAVIPTAAWSAVSANALTLFPTSNTILTNNGQPGFNAPAAQSTQRDDKGGFRVDGTTRYGAVSGYYHYDPWSQKNPATYGPTVPGFPDDNSGKAQLWVASLRTTFGSTAVNAFNASYTRNFNIQNITSSNGKDLASLGFDTNPADGGIVQLAPAQYQNWPSISVSTLGGVGAPGSIEAQLNNTYGGTDDFTKIIGTHTLQFGAQYHWDQVDLTHPLNGSNGGFGFNGTETGDGLADLLIGAPSSFSQGSPVALNLRNFYTGIYAEDSWRARQNLTLNYGVRWEVDPFWREEHNRNPMVLEGIQSTTFPTAPLGYVFPGDPGVPAHLSFINWHDFGPRLGAAYSPEFAHGLLHTIFGGQGKSSIRAGYGIHYTNIEGYNDFNIGSVPYSLYYPSPQPVLLAQPFIARATGLQLRQPFPLPTVQNAKTFDFSPYLPFSARRNPLLHSPSPYEEHVDLSVERALSAKTLLSLGYVGAFGHHLTVNADQNPGNVALCMSLSDPSEVSPDSPTCGPFGENRTYTTAAGQVINGTRGPLGPNFQGQGLELNIGNSAYNALMATLRYAADRLNFKVGYTLSKAIDNGSGRGDQVFLYGNHNFFRSLSDYDSRNNFVANYSYELPFDKLFRHDDRLTRGWKVSGITQFAQGIPVVMTESYDDASETGDNHNSPWGGSSTDEPVYTPGNIKGDHNPRHGNAWFNVNLFTPEAPGQQGNSPRRFFAGPGIDNTNVSLIKAVKITEHTSAEFRAEFYNALNHAQFQGLGNVDGEIGDGPGSFGFVGGDAGARMGQFAMKFVF